MRYLTAAGILAVALVFGGCTSHSDTITPTNTFASNGNPAGSTPPPPPGAATALFNPATGQLPYPTDLYFAAALATDAGVGATILEITPLHPLMPSTCISGGQFLGANCTTSTGYLVFLTNGIQDAAGNAAAADTDYAAIKAALAAGGATC